MIMDFVKEMEWRGMIHDSTPGFSQELQTGITSSYVGFDPTADSLHIGNLVPIMLLVHYQKCGHKPIALVGGATGLIGDPSGKSAERHLLTMDKIEYNLNCIKPQLELFLDFNAGDISAEIDIRSALSVPLCVACNVFDGKITISSSLVSNITTGEFKIVLFFINPFFCNDIESNKLGIISLCLL